MAIPAELFPLDAQLVNFDKHPQQSSSDDAVEMPAC